MSKVEQDEEIVHLPSNEEGQEVEDTPNNKRISNASCEVATRSKNTLTKPINNFKKKNNEIDREECVANMAAQKLTPIQNLPRNNNRVFKSPVRPFFCCGSQLSLNSVSEIIELEQSTSDKEETEFTDLSDCDEVTDLMANLTMHNRERINSGAKCRTGGGNLKKANGQGKGNVRRKFWTLRFKAKLSVPKRFRSEDEAALQEPCVCTSLSKTSNNGANTQQEPIQIGADLSQHHGPHASHSGARSRTDHGQTLQEFFLLAPVNFDELYPTEDIDERRIAQRRREMEEGIEISDIWVPQVQIGGATGAHDLSIEDEDYDNSFLAFESSGNNRESSGADYEESLYGECSFPMIPCNVFSRNSYVPPRAHSTVDYIHCLVPDILQITKCSYYWGVMDRYQAEKLLDKKPEGTFLLRDSAQDDYLFSVSFRRYGRSLHARIEQWNHKFSFDSHDPGVFASDTVCGLIEHYKDPSCCMFFEPMLTLPLHRNMPFSLQHLCRATISNYVNYDSINQLPLPKTLREYMRYYHYKQKIRVRRHDANMV